MVRDQWRVAPMGGLLGLDWPEARVLLDAQGAEARNHETTTPMTRPPAPEPTAAEREAAQEGGRPVPLAEGLDALVRAGYGRGHHDVAERLTWRQIRRLWAVDVQRRAEDLERLLTTALGR